MRRIDRDLARRLDCLADLGFEINGLILGAEQAKPGARSRLEQLKEQARRLDGGAWEYFRCIVALCRKELSSSAAVPNPRDHCRIAVGNRQTEQ